MTVPGEAAPGWTVPDDVDRAESALHQRMALACTAATDSRLPGAFRTWEQHGLRAVLVTDPALTYLSTVSGIAPHTVPAALGLLRFRRWAGVDPKLLVRQELCAAVGPELRAAGFEQIGERVLALQRLEPQQVAVGQPGGEVPPLEVLDADAEAAKYSGRDDFSTVLLAGYQVDGAAAAFIGAEHRHRQVLRFLARERQKRIRDLYIFHPRMHPIAAAAMTVHDGVAVLGGAGTLPAHRGRGAQSALQRHRLRVAVLAGCTLAVAAAAADSSSERNLQAAGFRVHRHALWQKV